MNLLYQTLIPSFTELTNQRFFKEFIQRIAFLFAETFRRHAHAPLVIHYIRETVFFEQSYRVKMAADRFPEVDFAFVISLFDGAQCRSVFMEIHKSAFLSVDKLCRHAAEVIVVVNIIVFYGFDAFRTHIRLDFFNILFNNAHLVRFKRRAGVACHTAFALAARELAAETGIEKLVGYYYVVNNYHGAKIQNFWIPRFARNDNYITKTKMRGLIVPTDLKERYAAPHKNQKNCHSEHEVRGNSLKINGV